MTHFTLDDLAAFSKDEQKLLSEFLNADPMTKSSERLMQPREESVRTILDYSKALSVRRSRKLDQISLVLN